jgi:hypothetical protein
MTTGGSDLHRRSLKLPYTAEYQGEAQIEVQVKVENSTFVTLTLSTLPLKGEGKNLD